MTWFILFVGVVVLCFVVALVLGLVGGGMGAATSSLSHEPLPDDELHDSDLDELRFDVGLRGYRMTQVDGVVDRLRRALREKDEQIAVLWGDPGVPRLDGADVGNAPVEREGDTSATTKQTDAVGPAPRHPSADAQASEAQASCTEPADEQTESQQRSEPSA
ncbi:MAG: DivIVA domain-containing protein [Humibacillus sp.]|nr:DivIVA domain-containing protein [Humibacillus sp.]MDN5777908.1 DivIVA domain-containing protein [Humibacillus sp.]